jgi:hypothetical protein
MEPTSGDFVINIPVEERTKRKALATLLVAHIDGLEEGASIRVVDGRGCVQEPLDIRGTTNQPIFSIPKWHGEFCPERMECFRQVRRAHGRAFPDWSTYSCQ